MVRIEGNRSYARDFLSGCMPLTFFVCLMFARGADAQYTDLQQAVRDGSNRTNLMAEINENTFRKEKLMVGMWASGLSTLALVLSSIRGGGETNSS